MHEESSEERGGRFLEGGFGDLVEIWESKRKWRRKRKRERKREFIPSYERVIGATGAR